MPPQHCQHKPHPHFDAHQPLAHYSGGSRTHVSSTSGVALALWGSAAGAPRASKAQAHTRSSAAKHPATRRRSKGCAHGFPPRHLTPVAFAAHPQTTKEGGDLAGHQSTFPHNRPQQTSPASCYHRQRLAVDMLTWQRCVDQFQQQAHLCQTDFPHAFSPSRPPTVRARYARRRDLPVRTKETGPVLSVQLDFRPSRTTTKNRKRPAPLQYQASAPRRIQCGYPRASAAAAPTEQAKCSPTFRPAMLEVAGRDWHSDVERCSPALAPSALPNNETGSKAVPSTAACARWKGVCRHASNRNQPLNIWKLSKAEADDRRRCRTPAWSPPCD